MELSKKEKENLIREISNELGGKPDGGRKNLIARCPYCQKEGKYGVYIGKETERKKPFMANCFSCGGKTQSLEQLLSAIGRPDLMVTPTADLQTMLSWEMMFPLEEEMEIDDELQVIDLPDFYRRVFAHTYLKERGFIFDDYDYFPVGMTGRLNKRFAEYVVFPVMDNGEVVGYVARHTWSKREIDSYNQRVKREGGYQILRFRNSTENDFVKLLYNIDSVIEDETETVVLVEGIFDVIALTRKLEWYDNSRIAAVATFGKKISQVQIYKLQCKGVRTVVIGYDGDAVEAIKKIVSELTPYFKVFVADIPDPEKDWEDLSHQEIYDIFSYRLMTGVEYKINKIQEIKWKI